MFHISGFVQGTGGVVGFGRPVASTLSFPDSPSCKGGKSGKSSFEHITESVQRQSAGHYPVPASQGAYASYPEEGQEPATRL